MAAELFSDSSRPLNTLLVDCATSRRTWRCVTLARNTCMPTNMRSPDSCSDLDYILILCTEQREFQWKACTRLQYAVCSCVEAKAHRQSIACYLPSSTTFVVFFPCLFQYRLSSLSAAMAGSYQQSCDILLPLSVCFRELQRTLPSRPLRLQKRAPKRRKRLVHR